MLRSLSVYPHEACVSIFFPRLNVRRAAMRKCDKEFPNSSTHIWVFHFHFRQLHVTVQPFPSISDHFKREVFFFLWALWPSFKIFMKLMHPHINMLLSGCKLCLSCLRMPGRRFSVSACAWDRVSGGSGHCGQTWLCENGVGLCDDSDELMISALYLDHSVNYYKVWTTVNCTHKNVGGINTSRRAHNSFCCCWTSPVNKIINLRVFYTIWQILLCNINLQFVKCNTQNQFRFSSMT